MIYVYDSRLVNICGFIADFDGRRNLFGFMNIFTLYIININKFFLSLVLACHVSLIRSCSRRGILRFRDL